VVDGDTVVAAPTLPVSLSADHRVVDGHDATGYLERALAFLRDPTA
jgi:pyruvate/2-oxoglutarate dehydrogenase complex dihydrolipoamide acyltransferase (E2) component